MTKPRTLVRQKTLAEMYKTVKQTGEMAWGQPSWRVPVTNEELPLIREGKLRICKETWDTVSRCRETGTVVEDTSEVCHNIRVRTNPSCRADLLVHPNCFKDIAVAANYFGNRLPEEFYKHYAGILVKC